ncbi:MAG: ribosome recycling factor [Candidatus Babeliaceae bacterium]|jgi:ribosome recycling factor
MIKFDYVEGSNTKGFEKSIETEMSTHIAHFEKELIKIRTGRSHTSMIEDIKVSCYGNMMPLKDLAALTAPDVQLLVIQPWDKSIMPEIEKAISLSDLGVTPLNDGNVIRIQLPRMSSNRRDELAKMLHKKLEECKISIRNVRKEFHNLIRDAEKGKRVSEDSSRRLQDILQKITDKFIENSDKLSIKKEEEIKSL